MKIFDLSPWLPESCFLCSAEGGEGGEGGGGGGGEGPGTRPEGLPDKFWNAKTGTDVTGLVKSYNEVEASFKGREDGLRATIEGERLANRPASADAYKFEMPSSVEIPAGYSIELKPDHPLVGFWRETAFDNGMNQEQFDAGVASYFQHAINDLPKTDATIATLGERGEERFNRARDWIKSAVSTEEFGILGSLVMTPEGITAVEKIMDKAGAPPLGDSAGAGTMGGEDDPKDEAKYDAKTKRIQEEAYSEKDEAKKKTLTEEVRKRFQIRYPGSKEPERNAPRQR